MVIGKEAVVPKVAARVVHKGIMVVRHRRVEMVDLKVVRQKVMARCKV